MGVSVRMAYPHSNIMPTGKKTGKEIAEALNDI